MHRKILRPGLKKGHRVPSPKLFDEPEGCKISPENLAAISVIARTQFGGVSMSRPSGRYAS